MDLKDTPELAEYRQRVRAWLDEHRHEGRDDTVEHHRQWQRTLAEAGYAAVTWPAEYGGQASARSTRSCSTRR